MNVFSNKSAAGTSKIQTFLAQSFNQYETQTLPTPASTNSVYLIYKTQSKLTTVAEL